MAQCATAEFDLLAKQVQALTIEELAIRVGLRLRQLKEYPRNHIVQNIAQTDLSTLADEALARLEVA